MQRLIIALLLVIFSAHSLGMAAGIKVLNASRAFAQVEQHDTERGVSSSSLSKAGTDCDDMTILSIAEELSDYVVLHPSLPNFRYQTPSLTNTAWMPASVILPKAPPPPRS